jgi:hypothetical protein
MKEIELRKRLLDHSKFNLVSLGLWFMSGGFCNFLKIYISLQYVIFIINSINCLKENSQFKEFFSFLVMLPSWIEYRVVVFFFFLF